MTKTISAFEQQVAIDKAMEALMPLMQASVDAGVTAPVAQNAHQAYLLLDKAFVALAKQRDAEMRDKWNASK